MSNVTCRINYIVEWCWRMFNGSWAYPMQSRLTKNCSLHHMYLAESRSSLPRFLTRWWATEQYAFCPELGQICAHQDMFQHASMKFNRMLKPWSSSCWSPYFLYLLILPQVESSPRCAAVLTVVLASSKTIARMTSIIIAPAKIKKSNHHCKLSQIITFVRVTKIFRQVTLVSSWGYGLPLPELKVQVHQAALIMAGRLLQFVFICIYYDH